MTTGIVLGIESSCDETSVAIVKDGKEILCNVIYSQIEEHAPFHGIVPELASRAHLEKINSVYEEAIEQSKIEIEQIDAIAVTFSPGLTGSLMIGANFAKSLSLVFGLPIIAINHLEAHLYAVGLEGYDFTYPFLGLLLSGGNSAIYEVKAPGRLNQLADTMDDACGEAFDKAASLLGFAYPGGPSIEKAAIEYALSNNVEHSYNENENQFPRLLKNMPSTQLAFSFSGIKTAVRNAVQKQNKSQLKKIAFDFQNTVFESVTRNLKRAVELTGIKTIVASGGVLANQVLRESLDKLSQQQKIKITYPKSRKLCTDNAAMVAAIGHLYHKSGLNVVSNDFDVSSKSCLPSGHTLI